VYKCTRCNRSVWDIDAKGVCRECLGGDIYRKDAASLLDSSPVHCYAVIEGVGYLLPKGEIHSGDLFITSGGLVYIQYAKTMLSGGSGAATGALIGGMVGGIIGAISDAAEDSNRRTAVGNLCYAAREEDFYMSVEDRVSKRGALVISASAIQSVESASGGDAFEIVHDGGRLALASPLSHVCLQLIRQIIKGTIKDRPDRWGVNAGRISVSALLDALEMGRPLDRLDDRSLTTMANDETFMARLYETFRRRKRRQQERITESMAGFPAAFRGIFRAFIDKEKPKAKLLLILTAVGVTPIIPAAIAAAMYAPQIDWSSTQVDNTVALFMLSIVFLLFVAPALIFFFIRSIIRFRHVNAMIARLT
jgi:hypothetical protein